MPMQRRLPKFGFKNINRVEYKAINISTLQSLYEKTGLTDINIEVLKNAGLVSKNDLVKILGKGELSAKLNVSAHGFSQTAKQVIEAKEETVTVIE